MCILTYLSETLSKKQKRGFFLAFVLIAGISVLEVITLVVDGLPPGYRWLNITANYLGFGLSPAVCICLVYVLDRKTALRREIRTAVRIEIGYLIFLFVTIPCGVWIIFIHVVRIFIYMSSCILGRSYIFLHLRSLPPGSFRIAADF